MEFFPLLEPYLNHFLAFSVLTFFFQLLGLKLKYSSLISLAIVGFLHFYYSSFIDYFSILTSLFNTPINLLIDFLLIGAGALIRASKERKKKILKAIKQQALWLKKTKKI